MSCLKKIPHAIALRVKARHLCVSPPPRPSPIKGEGVRGAQSQWIDTDAPALSVVILGCIVICMAHCMKCNPRLGLRRRYAPSPLMGEGRGGGDR